MVGRNPGYVTTQGQIVSDLFEAAGYPVLSASASLKKHERFLEILLTLVRHRRKIDVVCMEIYGGLSFLLEDTASLLSHALGLPVIMVLHGGDMPQFAARHPAWVGRVLQRASLLAAPSPFLIEGMRPYGFTPHLIPNVVDLAQYPYRHRARVYPRLFWMRSFHELYNPLMAVETLALVRRDLPDACLIMAGQDKGMAEVTRARASQLGLSDAVEFPGFLDMVQKAAVASRADIFINTNHVDNMPVSIVEAGAMGLPVVTTNVGGIPYLLADGENGLLVPDADAGSMARAVRRLVEEPSLAGKLSANGRKLAECSAWEQVRPLWDQAFAQVMRTASRQSEGL